MADTLIVLQCCKTKTLVEDYPNKSFDVFQFLPRTGVALQSAIRRNEELGVIDASTRDVTALSLYRGIFYIYPGLKYRVYSELEKDGVQFIILSAGYGIVHPFQRIHGYEQEMKGRVTSNWIELGVVGVLKEYIVENGFKQVYGMFSKSSGYKKMFEEIDWSKIPSVKRAGYFYLDEIRGTHNVLEGQARLLLELLEKGFDIEKVALSAGTVTYQNLLDGNTCVDLKNNIPFSFNLMIANH